MKKKEHFPTEPCYTWTCPKCGKTEDGICDNLMHYCLCTCKKFGDKMTRMIKSIKK